MKDLCQGTKSGVCTLMAMTLGIVLVGGLFFAGCRHAENEKKVEPQRVQARVMVAAEREVLLSRSFSGQVQAKRHILLSSKISGYVTRFKVQEGDFVRRGQTLLSLDDRELRDQIRSLDSQIQQVLQERSGVEARLAYARANFERFSSLYAEQAATREEFERARAEYQALQAQEESLQARAGSLHAKKGELESLLSYVRIKAPVSGWVVQKFVDVGSFAAAGQPLLAIDNQDLGFWFVAHVDESVLPKVKKGQNVQVVIPALEFQGTAPLAVLVPRIDPATRTFKIKVDLKGLSGARTGMYGRVYLPLGARHKLLIPARALRRHGQLSGVFVPDHAGVLHWRVLSLGDWFVRQEDASGELFVPLAAGAAGGARDRGAETWVEVLSGLSPGEQIVISNLSRIAEGMVLNL